MTSNRFLKLSVISSPDLDELVSGYNAESREVRLEIDEEGNLLNKLTGASKPFTVWAELNSGDSFHVTS